MLSKLGVLLFMAALHHCCRAQLQQQQQQQSGDETPKNNCQLARCPVDCETIVRQSVEQPCLDCLCTNTSRCLKMVCPYGCYRSTKLDGCGTCSCTGPTYAITDERRQTETFLQGLKLKRIDARTDPHIDGTKSGTRGQCSLEDRKKVNECLVDYNEFQQKLKANDPQRAQLYYLFPQFSLNREELSYMCSIYYDVQDCVGVNMRSRCRWSHQQMNAMEVLLEAVCDEQNGQTFFDHFECIYAVLHSSATAEIRQCTSDAQTELTRPNNALQPVKEKTRQKCNALNEFLECTKPVMVHECSEQHYRMFRTSMLATAVIPAPECFVSRNLSAFVAFDSTDRANYFSAEERLQIIPTLKPKIAAGASSNEIKGPKAIKATPTGILIEPTKPTSSKSTTTVRQSATTSGASQATTQQRLIASTTRSASLQRQSGQQQLGRNAIAEVASKEESRRNSIELPKETPTEEPLEWLTIADFQGNLRSDDKAAQEALAVLDSSESIPLSRIIRLPDGNYSIAPESSADIDAEAERLSSQERSKLSTEVRDLLAEEGIQPLFPESLFSVPPSETASSSERTTTKAKPLSTTTKATAATQAPQNITTSAALSLTSLGSSAKPAKTEKNVFGGKETAATTPAVVVRVSAKEKETTKHALAQVLKALPETRRNRPQLSASTLLELKQPLPELNAENETQQPSFLDFRETLNASQTDLLQLSLRLSANDSENLCLAVLPRPICPDGTRPQTVLRFFRHKVLDDCIPYQYMYCSMELERIEQPIKYQEDCFNNCFTKDEKNRMPIFTNLKFRGGFRIRN